MNRTLDVHAEIAGEVEDALVVLAAALVAEIEQVVLGMASHQAETSRLRQCHLR